MFRSRLSFAERARPDIVGFGHRSRLFKEERIATNMFRSRLSFAERRARPDINSLRSFIGERNERSATKHVPFAPPKILCGEESQTGHLRVAPLHRATKHVPFAPPQIICGEESQTGHRRVASPKMVVVVVL
jgi:hypothetical protein